MYESKRVTISYPAIERLSQVYGLPNDLPSQTLAGYVERLIFECLCKHSYSPVAVAQTVETSTEPAQSTVASPKPNLGKLAAMAKSK